MTVLVREDGFEYDGRRYRSLTVIAEKITGAHWSGPRFFGLTKRGGGNLLETPPKFPRNACIWANPATRGRHSSPQGRAANFALEAGKPLTSTRCPHIAR